MATSFIISILLLAVALLLSHYFTIRESFIGDPNAVRCGVDQPPCPFGTACMNGWCVSSMPPPLPPTTGLPVLP